MKVFHPCDGGPRRRTMYLATVDWAISMPSLSNSPWIRGAPHSGFSRRSVERDFGRWPIGQGDRPAAVTSSAKTGESHVDASVAGSLAGRRSMRRSGKGTASRGRRRSNDLWPSAWVGPAPTASGYNEVLLQVEELEDVK